MRLKDNKCYVQQLICTYDYLTPKRKRNRQLRHWLIRLRLSQISWNRNGIQDDSSKPNIALGGWCCLGEFQIRGWRHRRDRWSGPLSSVQRGWLASVHPRYVIGRESWNKRMLLRVGGTWDASSPLPKNVYLNLCWPLDQVYLPAKNSPCCVVVAW